MSDLIISGNIGPYVVKNPHHYFNCTVICFDYMDALVVFDIVGKLFYYTLWRSLGYLQLVLISFQPGQFNLLT